MSEPDSTPRSPPPTIDLKAEEIGGPKPSGHAFPYVIGIAVGAVAVVALGAALWTAGLFPAHQTATTQTPAAPAAQSGDSAEISARLDKIQQALDAPRSDEALTNRIAAAEAQSKSLADTVAALTRRVDDVAAAVAECAGAGFGRGRCGGRGKDRRPGSGTAKRRRGVDEPHRGARKRGQVALRRCDAATVECRRPHRGA